jgi:hypothetical protein
VIRVAYTISHLPVPGGDPISLPREVTSDFPARDLPADVREVLGLGMRPAAEEETRLTLDGPLRHTTLGISTHNLRRRAMRRLADSILPPGTEETDPVTKACWMLITHGKATFRWSPFFGLVASRD